MPILTATDPLRKRHLPVWALILAVAVLPPVGLFAWSCYQPVRLGQGMRRVVLGRFTRGQIGKTWHCQPGLGWCAFKLPGGRKTGWYVASWIWFQ